VEREVLPLVRRAHLGVLAYSPMASGLLTGAMSRERVAGLQADDWRKNSPAFQEPRLSRNLRLVELLRSVGAGHNRTAGQVAVAWVLQNPAVTGAIVGARRPGQLAALVGAADLHLTVSDLAALQSFFAREAA